MSWPKAASLWRVVAMIGGCVVYVAALPYLGQAIAGGMTCLVVLQVMSEYRWPAKIAVAIAGGGGSYLLFDVLLKVPLPGVIWFR